MIFLTKRNDNGVAVIDGIDSTANVLSLIHPAFAGLTIITFVIKQIINYVCTDDISIRVLSKDNTFSLCQNIPWTGYQHAHVVIRSIRIFSYRGDICLLPAAVSMNPRSRMPEHNMSSRKLLHGSSVWNPHPELLSVPSPSFSEPLHATSAHGNDLLHCVSQERRYVPSAPY